MFREGFYHGFQNFSRQICQHDILYDSKTEKQNLKSYFQNHKCKITLIVISGALNKD